MHAAIGSFGTFHNAHFFRVPLGCIDDLANRIDHQLKLLDVDVVVTGPRFLYQPL